MKATTIKQAINKETSESIKLLNKSFGMIKRETSLDSDIRIRKEVEDELLKELQL